MQDLKFISPGSFHFNGPDIVPPVLINRTVNLDYIDPL